jgi:hypothetical protein
MTDIKSEVYKAAIVLSRCNKSDGKASVLKKDADALILASKRSRSKEAEPLPYNLARPTTPEWLKRCREGIPLPSNINLFLSNNETGFKNVARTNHCFTIRIKRNGECFTCGTFPTAIDAAIAYAKYIDIHGSLASLLARMHASDDPQALSVWTCRFCGDKTYTSRDALRKHCRKVHLDHLVRNDRFWKE